MLKNPHAFHSLDLTEAPLNTITPKAIIEAAAVHRRIVMTSRQVTELRRQAYDQFGPSMVMIHSAPPAAMNAPPGAVGSVGNAWLIERPA